MRLPIDPAALRIQAAVATLDNGLRVVAHRDPKAPLVAVHIVYRAGSREEPPGKHGLAHLFEHLMFCGSEHSPGNFFIPMEGIGATSINAHAADDYAAYFATVPADALDYALWMEAERMGCLGGALSQASLDRQREIVRNELMQRAREPYWRAAAQIRRISYPRGHPYAHDPYGDIDDLETISIDDARRWYEAYYGPANATLVIAGDLEPRDAIETARRRFAAIRGGPGAAQFPGPVIEPASGHRLTFDEAHAPRRLYRAWHVPGSAAPECAELEIACELIADGPSSPLFKRLVERRQLASEVGIEFQRRELGSQIVLSATVAPAAKVADLESALDAELARCADEIPSAEDCEAACARIASRFVKDTERVGGPRGKSDRLAAAMLASGDPAAATAHFDRMARLDAAEIRAAAARWLNGVGSVVEIGPTPRPRPRPRSVVHTAAPGTIGVSPFRAPQPVETRLDNGIRVIAVERRDSRLFELRIVLETGASAERPDESGLANLAMRMLGRTRVDPDRRSIADELARHGATFRASASLDGSVIEVSASPRGFTEVMTRVMRVVKNPDFDEPDLAAAKAACAAAIRGEIARPFDLATRLIPLRVFRGGHPYAQPFTGSGSERGITSATAERVRNFYSRALASNRAALILVGPGKADATIAMAEHEVHDWRRSPDGPPDPQLPPQDARRPKIALLDRPERTQTAIFAALPLPAHRDGAIDSLVVANTMLGGRFDSRLNRRLREASGWAYGGYSRMLHARHAGLWMAWSFVRADRAAAAIDEIRRAFPGINGEATDEAEFRAARDYLIRCGASGYETNAQIADALAEEAALRAGDFHAGFEDRVTRLSCEDFTEVCARHVDAASIAWLVVGDGAKLADELAAAGFEAIEMVAESDL